MSVSACAKTATDPTTFVRACRIVVPLLAAVLLIGVQRAMTEERSSGSVIAIIPQPASLTVHDGTLQMGAHTQVFLDDGGTGAVPEARLVAKLLHRIAGCSDVVQPLSVPEASVRGVLLKIDTTKVSSLLGPEGYTLEVTPDAMRIVAGARAGLFYGIQTLLQLLPSSSLDSTVHGSSVVIPCLSIVDRPRFPYRGMHLDVSRHFFPVAFVKRYIDLLSFHKMNVFHWHLTDDNGWRIEIPRYPLLTKISAWRVDRSGTTWRECAPQKEGEVPTYGGFYTQAQIREIVAYAEERHVTIIPEIEMPGHTSEVLAAYPQLSCTGGPFTVATGAYWPNVDIFCAGNDSVFTFLEDVLGDVMKLFPGPYIHIGGDEADKRRWRACERCQTRIRVEGLHDEDELQSYFMKRVEKILTKGGKRLVGWDEILQGGLPAEATVMSWRGVEGGIDAARQGHDVIMTPVSHCYFDYYQADPEFEPEAIGGYTTLKEVYGYEPLPSELSAEEARHVLGAQGNLWSEYIATPSHAEYMALPRMSALAEVVWTPRRERQWKSFRNRLNVHLTRFDALGVNYSKGSFRPSFETLARPEQGQVDVVITAEQSHPVIRYTVDGTDPDGSSSLYQGPIRLDESSWIGAALFDGDRQAGRAVAKEVILHDAVGSRVVYRTPFSDRFPSDSTTLVDGLTGSLDHSDGHWQVFLGTDMDVDLILSHPVQAQRIVVSFLGVDGSRIVAPYDVGAEVSADGKTFARVSASASEDVEVEGPAHRIEWTFEPDLESPTVVIRIKAQVDHACPAGHPLEGMQTFLFVDEISVEP